MQSTNIVRQSLLKKMKDSLYPELEVLPFWEWKNDHHKKNKARYPSHWYHAAYGRYINQERKRYLKERESKS